MINTERKTRGNISKEKLQVNWRVRKDIIQKLKEEANNTGFSTIAQLINHILFMRYFNKGKGE